MTMALKDRIALAILNTPPERRGYALANLDHLGTSLGDLLTDLAPFIEAEVKGILDAEEGAIESANEREADARLARDEARAEVEQLQTRVDEAEEAAKAYEAKNEALVAEIDRLRAIEALRVDEIGGILAKHAAAVGTVGPMPKPTGAEPPPGREDVRAAAVRRAFESALTDDPTMLSRAWQAVTFAADVTRETYPSSPARRRLVEDELRRAPADRTPLFWPAAAKGEGLGPEPGILAPAATAPADASLEARESLRIAIERIVTEEGEDPAEELFESAQDLVHGEAAEAHEEMIEGHRERVNALRAAFVAWRAVDASRPGLTEEQAREMTRHDPAELRALQAAGIARGEPFSVPLDDLLIATEEREMAHPDAGKRCSRCGRPAYNCADPCVCDPADVAALLRASRGAPSPGDVVISRAILEKLAKAAASDPDAREARWAAERILQQATLAAEPARTDPEAARLMAAANRAGHYFDPATGTWSTPAYDGAHAPARVLCPTCERWHFSTDCCQA